MSDLTEQQSKLLIEELHQAWNTGDLEPIPDIYTESFIGHWKKGWRTGDIIGLDGITQSIQRSRQIFPDWHEEVEDLFVAGDRVVSRYHSTGTHHGSYLGKTGTEQKVSFQEISIFRIENGKVAEQWVLAVDTSTPITEVWWVQSLPDDSIQGTDRRKWQILFKGCNAVVESSGKLPTGESISRRPRVLRLLVSTRHCQRAAPSGQRLIDSLNSSNLSYWSTCVNGS